MGSPQAISLKKDLMRLPLPLIFGLFFGMGVKIALRLCVKSLHIQLITTNYSGFFSSAKVDSHDELQCFDMRFFKSLFVLGNNSFDVRIRQENIC